MKEYDVIVAGGGTAGCAAAIAAARNGAKTLLVESAGYLGGMATNAAVPAFCPFTNGKELLIRGIGLEILERLKKICYVSPFYDEKPDRIRDFDWVPVDAEALKLVLDEMITENGIQVLYHTTVIDVECADNRIQSLTLHNKSGACRVKGRIVIDCSGDADVAAMAGFPCEFGDEDGLVQSATLCFKIGNFNVGRFMKYAEEVNETGNLTVACSTAKAAGDFPEGEQKVAGIAIYADGMASLNFGHVYRINPLNGEDLTRAEIEARRKLPELMRFLRKYVPGAEHAVLASSGPHIGLRESRRIVGEYQMTVDDYYRRADFPDAIAYYSYPIDLHAAKQDLEESEEAKQLYHTSKYRNGEAYAIPYRSLLPKKAKNLLAAGRIISADRAILASVRVMPACFATGQAAGTAAALCCKEGKNPYEISPEELRTVLKHQGVYLRS